jgi:hypothetical protein
MGNLHTVFKKCSFVSAVAVSSVIIAATGLYAQLVDPALGLPAFKYSKILVDFGSNTSMKWNPSGEWIFPTIITTEKLTAPLGKYYMYFSGHAHAGIGMMYANNLDGPWTEYANNPVISGEYASAHAIWIEESKQLLCFYHGPNTQTQFSTSTDGIHFSGKTVAVTTANFNGTSECSYCRVFRYTLPGKTNKFILMGMGNFSGTRKIFLAWSDDAKVWTSQREPIIVPPPNSGGQACAPFLVNFKGQDYIMHHCDNMSIGDIWIQKPNATWTQFTSQGIFLKARTGYPDNLRVSDPTCYIEGNSYYMFYTAGVRLQGGLAIAKAPYTPPVAVLPQNEGKMNGFTPVSFSKNDAHSTFYTLSGRMVNSLTIDKAKNLPVLMIHNDRKTGKNTMRIVNHTK